MRPIGFSTGALARHDARRALQMLKGKAVNAIELSALRQDELAPLIEQLDDLDLSPFKYKSFHAPSSIELSFDVRALELLESVVSRGWPVIVHPDAIHTSSEWARFGSLLCIENMDKRKIVGQTAADLDRIFRILPEASFCFDFGHARQVDPTMSEAASILHAFRHKLKQVHMSEVNSQSKHDPLTLEAEIAFQRVAQLVPSAVPVILESRVEESDIDAEIESAVRILDPHFSFAIAGD